ncbi:hypothetical protein HNQ80_003769 [Anaerosolibacter carboniphilus]|uniref:Alkyl hydroperoxide reductase subunit C/ Thiol specific antioxidant domain-containing protein n=1 Tax=Anaerosolibacter carboniphilus TaxID=1417629 RepID=A0A841KVE9_9FIRM|nr:hypothetical protein [Anaerosolibacter carboniphilus]
MQFPHHHWMNPYWRTWQGSEMDYYRSTPSYRSQEYRKDFYDYFDLEDPAPDFTLEAVIEGEPKDISLSDYQGKWVVLFFYGSDFTYV